MVDRMPGIPEWNAGSGVQDLGVPRLAAWGPLAAKAGSGRVARMLEEAATDPHDAAAGDRPARSLRAAYRRLRRVKDARPAPPDALAVLDPAAAAIRDLMPLARTGAHSSKGRSRPKTAPIRRDLFAERRGEWPEIVLAAGTGRPGHSPRRWWPRYGCAGPAQPT